MRRAWRALAAVALLAAWPGCTLLVPGERHEREPRPPAESGRCSTGCLPASVCASATDLCHDCWSTSTSSAWIDLREGGRALAASALMRPLTGVSGASELFVAAIVEPTDAPRHLMLVALDVGYDEASAEHRALGATREVPLRGDFDALGEPVDLRLLLDARERVSLVALGFDGLVAGVLAEGELVGRVRDVAGARGLRTLDAEPHAGDGHADDPDVLIAALGEDEVGASVVIASWPREGDRASQHALSEPADVLELDGPAVLVGQRADDHVPRVVLGMEPSPPTSIATPERTGPIAAIDSDGACRLYAWPTHDSLAIALGSANGASCARGEGPARPTAWLRRGDAASTLEGVQLVRSRVGVLALVRGRHPDGWYQTLSVLDRDGWPRFVEGHGHHPIQAGDGSAVLAVGSEQASDALSSPWPLALISVREAGPLAVSLGRACDAAVR